MMEKVTLMCPCLFGLESVLSFEVKKLGGENIVVTDGRVTFDGDLSMVAKANIWLRTAERVGIVIGSFRAETFTELFDQTAELPWEQFIGEDDCFPVKAGQSIRSFSACRTVRGSSNALLSGALKTYTTKHCLRKQARSTKFNIQSIRTR